MADSVAQNFSKVQPDGSILFDFDGHVRARGLDLDAGDSVTPPADDRIRWLRTDNGEVVADLTASSMAGGNSLEIKGRRTAGAGAAVFTSIEALDGVTGARARLRMGTGIPTSIAADAGAITRIVIDDTGASDFARLPVRGDAMFAGARCDGRPASLALLGSVPAGGITAIARTGLGTYTLTTGASAPSGLWFGVAMPQGFAAMGGEFAPLSATTFQVRLQDAAGAFVDDLFTVIVGG